MILATLCALAISGCAGSSVRFSVAPQAVVPVEVLPVLADGTVGWCVTTIKVGGGCPVGRLKRGPIIAEQWFGTGGVRVTGPGNETATDGEANVGAEGFALTTANVAAVAVNGRGAIVTRREPGLPSGLRAVVVKVHGAWAHEVKVPSLFGRPPHEAPAALPRFTPLDHADKPMEQKNEPGFSPIVEIPGQRWKRPEKRPPRPCSIRSSGLRGLVAQGGFVVNRAKPVNGLIGRPFLSCATTSYSLGKAHLVAGVLLDADQPGTSPGSLPGMQRVGGSPGVFAALSSTGAIAARRVPKAWLVVGGGQDEQQRLTVLARLRATVDL